MVLFKAAIQTLAARLLNLPRQIPIRSSASAGKEEDPLQYQVCTTSAYLVIGSIRITNAPRAVVESLEFKRGHLGKSQK